MRVHNFIIPKTLQELIRMGMWTPTGSQPGHMINLGKESARKLSPEDDLLMLMPPPFHTIADEVSGGNHWWNTLTNVGEIDYAKAVMIADFGMGSDSPIILYYEDTGGPYVMYLYWSSEDHNPIPHWVCTHRSFDAFAAHLEIERDAPPGRGSRVS